MPRIEDGEAGRQGGFQQWEDGMRLARGQFIQGVRS
jgi:hypothetical protein